MAEDNKIIYSMIGVSKKHGSKIILKDIYLSYFYGAKIGVLGLNGTGKSTLLRILAGVDKDFIGETALSEGLTIGYHLQRHFYDQHHIQGNSRPCIKKRADAPYTVYTYTLY